MRARPSRSGDPSDTPDVLAVELLGIPMIPATTLSQLSSTQHQVVLRHISRYSGPLSHDIRCLAFLGALLQDGDVSARTAWRQLAQTQAISQLPFSHPSWVAWRVGYQAALHLLEVLRQER